MKIVQIVPREEFRLYAALVKKEADIRRKGLGTFYRAAVKKRNSTKWRHKAYRGWINLARIMHQAAFFLHVRRAGARHRSVRRNGARQLVMQRVRG
jgi:hypothetical protein